MEEKNESAVLAIKNYFVLFFGYFILEEIFKYIARNEVFSIDDYRFIFNLVYTSFSIGILYYVFHRVNSKKNIISISDFDTNLNQIIYSVMLGLSLGILLPLISCIGYFFPDTFFYEITEVGIKAMSEYGKSYSFVEYFILMLFGSVLFSVMREIIFRGVLFKLFRENMNITKATLQVSFLFTLLYMGSQFIQIDIFSLMILSVILCFITFKQKSLLPTIIITISYDIPQLILFRLEDFQLNPTDYIVPNMNHIIYYIIAIVMSYVAFIQFNKESDLIDG